MNAKAKTAKPAKAKTAAKQQQKEKELRPDGLVKGSKAALLVDTVCRPKGATNEELCEVVGWKQCMPYVKSSAAKAGVVIKTEKKEGEATRYFGTAKGAKKKPVKADAAA